MYNVHCNPLFKSALALAVTDPFQRCNVASADGILPISAWKGRLHICFLKKRSLGGQNNNSIQLCDTLTLSKVYKYEIDKVNWHVEPPLRPISLSSLGILKYFLDI